MAAEFRLCHARPTGDTCLLHVFRRGDEQHRVDFALATGFKQQRNVEDDKIGTRGPCLVDKLARWARTRGWSMASSRASAVWSLNT